MVVLTLLRIIESLLLSLIFTQVHSSQPHPYGPLVEDILRTQAEFQQKQLESIRVTSYGPRVMSPSEMEEKNQIRTHADKEMEGYVHRREMLRRRRAVRLSFSSGNGGSPRPFSNRLLRNFSGSLGGGSENGSSAIGASPMLRNQSSSSSSLSSSSKRSGGQGRQNRPSRSFGARVVSMADLGRRSHQHLGGAVERRRRRGSAAALDAALDDDDDGDYVPEINGGSGTTGSAAGGDSMYLEDDGVVTSSEDDANDSDYLAAVPRRPVYRDTSEESDVTSEDDDEVNCFTF